MANPIKYRIGWLAIAILLVTAVVADTLTLVPFVGGVVGPIYWIGVSIFLYIKGFGILNARRFITSIVSTIGEVIPGIQEFPLIIGGIIVLIVFSRIEDKAKGQTNPVQSVPSRKPLNIDGVRQPSK